MIQSIKLRTLKTFVVFILLHCCSVYAGDWSNLAEVRYDVQRCVSYRARLSGDFLVVEATHEPGWHTYALDNKQRAQEKLAGRKALSIDRPTEIELKEGLQLAGSWYQSVPKDFSKPELRSYTWGFEAQALFAAKIRRVGAGPGSATIRGQACSEATCKNIEVELSVPFSGSKASNIDLKNLIQVR